MEVPKQLLTSACWTLKHTHSKHGTKERKRYKENSNKRETQTEWETEEIENQTKMAGGIQKMWKNIRSGLGTKKKKKIGEVKWRKAWENNREEDLDQMVTQEGGKTEWCKSSLPIIPPSLSSFFLSCSALMPHREAAEANLLPAAAPSYKWV